MPATMNPATAALGVFVDSNASSRVASANIPPRPTISSHFIPKLTGNTPRP
jgi:hypothetical protein